MTPDHPIRLLVTDDLERSRLTVFFRLILAIPHLLWVGLYGIAAFVCTIVAWFTALFRGRANQDMHDFISGWVRYVVHVYAYLLLAANPYPGFLGRPGYPIDLAIEPAARQNRWKTGFRFFLALPALILGGGLPSGSVSTRGSRYGVSVQGAISSIGGVAAFLGWFACLVRGRMPRGLRDAVAYSIGYAAQVNGYLLLLTDRYPNSDPARLVGTIQEPSPHPVHLEVRDELRRSRLTTFFRLPLAVPHIVWLILWGVLFVLAGILNWFATLATGRSPHGLHRFIAAYVRYQVHVTSFLYLVANPFPGFVGAPGSYPVEVVIAPPERQNRWKTGFRGILWIPALLLGSAYSGVLGVAAIGAWFASLFTAKMPGGLRNVGAVAVRYQAQLYAYLFMLTDRYPYGGPTDAAFAPPLPAPPPPPPPPGT